MLLRQCLLCQCVLLLRRRCVGHRLRLRLRRELPEVLRRMVGSWQVLLRVRVPGGGTDVWLFSGIGESESSTNTKKCFYALCFDCALF